MLPCPSYLRNLKALPGVAWYGSAYLLTIITFQPGYGSCYKLFSVDLVYRLPLRWLTLAWSCAQQPRPRTYLSSAELWRVWALCQVVELERRPLYTSIVVSTFVVAVSVGPILGARHYERGLIATSDQKFKSMDPLGCLPLSYFAVGWTNKTVEFCRRYGPSDRRCFS
nr:mfs thioclapurine efflux transporter tcpa [Quercus suber]